MNDFYKNLKKETKKGFEKNRKELESIEGQATTGDYAAIVFRRFIEGMDALEMALLAFNMNDTSVLKQTRALRDELQALLAPPESNVVHGEFGA